MEKNKQDDATKAMYQDPATAHKYYNYTYIQECLSHITDRSGFVVYCTCVVGILTES